MCRNNFKSGFLLVAISTCFSCTFKDKSDHPDAGVIVTDQQDVHTKTPGNNQTLETIDVPCSQDEQVIIDTTFMLKYHFKMTGECAQYNDFEDTIELENRVYQVRYWKAQKFVICSSLFDKDLIIDKQVFKDFLATDLVTNGILSTPFEFQFHPDDKSVSFKVFIGRADTDIGDVYGLKLARTGKPIVISVETLDDWTD